MIELKNTDADGPVNGVEQIIIYRQSTLVDNLVKQTLGTWKAIHYTVVLGSQETLTRLSCYGQSIAV